MKEKIYAYIKKHGPVSISDIALAIDFEGNVILRLTEE